MNFGKIKHFLLFGGGQLLFDLARELANGNHSVHVVTSRRHALSSVNFQTETMELVEALRSIHIPYTATANIKNSDEISGLVADHTLGISISAEWIFDKEFISKFQGRLVNMHGTRLPAHRGGGELSWAIMQGDQSGGATLHMLNVRIDAGAVVASKQFTFPDQCTTSADYQRISNEHGSDDEVGTLGVDYSKYANLYEHLKGGGVDSHQELRCSNQVVQDRR